MSRTPRTAVAMTPLLSSLRPGRSPCVRSGAEQSHPPARNQRLLTLPPLSARACACRVTHLRCARGPSLSPLKGGEGL